MIKDIRSKKIKVEIIGYKRDKRGRFLNNEEYEKNKRQKPREC